MSTRPTLNATQMLAPIPVDQFFADYWEQRTLLIPRNQVGYYDSVLTLADLDQHLQSRQLPAHFFRIVNKGDPVPLSKWTRSAPSNVGEDGDPPLVVVPEKLWGEYLVGSTIIISGTQQGIPPLIEFGTALEREWLVRAQTNLYLTPPRAQGFAAHYDFHCVCILQVHGEKTWRLYESDNQLPVTSKAYRTEAPPGKLKQEFVLRPGDLLYLPRGQVHEACTSDSASLHITLGLFPHYTFELMAQLTELAKLEPALRRGFSLRPSGQGGIVDGQARLAAWLTQADLAKLPGLLHQQWLGQRLASLRGRFTDVLRADQLTATSLVARRHDVAFTTERRGDELVLAVADQNLTVSALVAPAMAWLERAEPFRPAQLPALLLPPRKVQLAADLVRLGVLRIEQL